MTAGLLGYQAHSVGPHDLCPLQLRWAHHNQRAEPQVQLQFLRRLETFPFVFVIFCIPQTVASQFLWGDAVLSSLGDTAVVWKSSCCVWVGGVCNNVKSGGVCQSNIHVNTKT